jgi:BirA family biotin operon repressor/biotin-[acetyl-CoA-carboxylase] ligase
MPRTPPFMTRLARALRNNPTEAERLIWARISQYSPRFTRQHRVGPYILDIACRSAKLAVELDGSQHLDSERDAVRTDFIEKLGWRVLRFWNSDVIANPDGVAETILDTLGTLGWPTHPRPLPSREGRKRQSRRQP